MRYDSDPQVVKRISTEADGLQNSLNRVLVSETPASEVFDEFAPLISSLLDTLDHFITLHSLNPQFSLSRFSAHYIEKKLSSIQKSIAELFRQKEFPTLEDQVFWHLTRFVNPEKASADNEQLLVGLYTRLVQVLETYYSKRVRNTHIAAILNEFVGWAEHIDMHGHHDAHSVIIFAEKVARDRAVIEHRVEIVREICVQVEERAYVRASQGFSEHRTVQRALELSQIYSSYLLNLYEALLEDIEIIAISNHDYHAFEAYCHARDIDIYEEYHEVLKDHFRKYVESIAADISSSLELIKTANTIVNAGLTDRRYFDLEVPEEVLGQPLSQDIRILSRAVQVLEPTFPEMSQQYALTLQKIRSFKGEIMKPAIKVYGEYLKSSEEFFRHLPQNQTRWIPILDSALACLEQHDDLYQKCHQLKKEIDEFVATQ